MSDAPAGLVVKGSEILGDCRFPDRDYKIKRYDWRRPDKFSKDQIRTVHIIHEVFSRLLDTKVSTMLRSLVSSRVSCVDQLTYEEFIESTETPTLLAAVRMSPLKGTALMHAQPPLREAMLDRLFGDPRPKADAENARELSDLEFAALEGLLVGLCSCMSEAWSMVIPGIAVGLSQVETNPRFAQIVPPSEMIVLSTLEVEIAGISALMTCVYPYLTIEPIVPRLSAHYWYSAARGEVAPKDQLLPPSTTWRLSGPAELLADGARLTAAELRALKRGSLVAIPGLDAGKAWVRSGGVRVLELGFESRALGGFSRGASLELTVESDPASESELPSDLLPIESRRNTDASAAGLEAGFAAFRESFERTIAGLAEGLKRVESGQAAFADRLSFGVAESETNEVVGGLGEARPFASLGSVPSEDLGLFLSVERPQLVALVLSWIDDAPASRIMDLLPPPLRVEVVKRLARIERVSPEVLKVVEKVLSRKMKATSTESRSSGGIPKIVGILNQTRRETEKQVIEDLDGLDRGLCEEIKRNMFVFEDLSLLDAESIALLLQRAEEDDIVLGLKPLDAAMRARVLARAEPAVAARLLARAEAMGRVRLSECDAAGQRVVAVARALDGEGLLCIVREENGE